MSDQQQSQELSEHGHRIAQLELKVAELYKRIGQAEPSFGGGSDFGEAPIGADHPRVIELIQAGNELGAIKLYRELTGAGLAESKDAVEELAKTYPPLG
jgi:ribosomal protein L7/L12